jgi:hypothetical protein
VSGQRLLGSSHSRLPGRFFLAVSQTFFGSLPPATTLSSNYRHAFLTVFPVDFFGVCHAECQFLNRTNCRIKMHKPLFRPQKPSTAQQAISPTQRNIVFQTKSGTV